jgi:hypothetical protein
MSTDCGKTAQDILGSYTRLEETFESYEARRLAWVRDVLRRVVTEIALQEKLATELKVRREGFFVRSEYPDWARRLAEVLRNPDGKYSEGTRKLVYGFARDLHAEAAGPRVLGRPLAEFLVRDGSVPVLSDIARELLSAPGSQADQPDRGRNQ